MSRQVKIVLDVLRKHIYDINSDVFLSELADEIVEALNAEEEKSLGGVLGDK